MTSVTSKGPEAEEAQGLFSRCSWCSSSPSWHCEQRLPQQELLSGHSSWEGAGAAAQCTEQLPGAALIPDTAGAGSIFSHWRKLYVNLRYCIGNLVMCPVIVGSTPLRVPWAIAVQGIEQPGPALCPGCLWPRLEFCKHRTGKNAPIKKGQKRGLCAVALW